MILKHKIFIAAGIGAALECYDFMICAFMASYLISLFFPKNALLGIFAIFTVAFVSRPLGGIFWAHFGDRFGRKKVFSLTMLLLVLPTLGIALFPTQYTSLWTRALGFMSLRFIQGFLVGGEFAGGVTFIAETSSAQYRGLSIASFMMFLTLGTLFASSIVLILNFTFSKAQILNYAWRIPFLISVILISIAIYIRKRIDETPLFKALKARTTLSNIPLLELLRMHRSSIGKGLIITSASAISLTTLYLYFPQLFKDNASFNTEHILALTSMGSLLLCLMMPLGGYLADCFGRKIIFSSALILLSTTLLLFHLALQQHSFNLLLIAMTLASFFYAGINANYCVLLSELFPTCVRFTGIAVCYNFAFALCGGLVPLLYTHFSPSLGVLSLPSTFFISITLLSLYVLAHIKDRSRQELQS